MKRIALISMTIIFLVGIFQPLMAGDGAIEKHFISWEKRIPKLINSMQEVLNKSFEKVQEVYFKSGNVMSSETKGNFYRCYMQFSILKDSCENLPISENYIKKHKQLLALYLQGIEHLLDRFPKLDSSKNPYGEVQTWIKKNRVSLGSSMENALIDAEIWLKYNK